MFQALYLMIETLLAHDEVLEVLVTFTVRLLCLLAWAESFTNINSLTDLHSAISRRQWLWCLLFGP